MEPSLLQAERGGCHLFGGNRRLFGPQKPLGRNRQLSLSVVADEPLYKIGRKAVVGEAVVHSQDAVLSMIVLEDAADQLQIVGRADAFLSFRRSDKLFYHRVGRSKTVPQFLRCELEAVSISRVAVPPVMLLFQDYFPFASSQLMGGYELVFLRVDL